MDGGGIPKHSVIGIEWHRRGFDPDNRAAIVTDFNPVFGGGGKDDQFMAHFAKQAHFPVNIAAHAATARRIKFTDIDDPHPPNPSA